MKTIYYRGEPTYVAELARRFGLSERTLRSRIERGQPEAAWGLPARRKTPAKPQAKPKVKPRVKPKAVVPYTDEELRMLWRDGCRYAIPSQRYKILSDFAACSEERAEAMVKEWKRKGLIT